MCGTGDEGQEAPAGFKRAAPFAERGGSASPPGQGVKLPAGSRGRATAGFKRAAPFAVSKGSAFAQCHVGASGTAT